MMKVSVSIITYNHEEYIAQAIDSVLMQKTNFDYEILIGEDDSNDNTRAIVTEYKERYPDKIRLFLNDRENVIYINGRPTGRWNLINNLKHARGQYIALLDGDDYWIDPHKLQKQVDFLDSHPECAMCFHNAYNLLPDQSKVDYMREWFRVNISPYYELEDLLTQNFVPTASVLFRNRLIKEFHHEFYKIPAGDWLFLIMLAQRAKLGFMNEIWSVRRMHEGGVISIASSRISSGST